MNWTVSILLQSTSRCEDNLRICRDFCLFLNFCFKLKRQRFGLTLRVSIFRSGLTPVRCCHSAVWLPHCRHVSECEIKLRAGERGRAGKGLWQRAWMKESLCVCLNMWASVWVNVYVLSNSSVAQHGSKTLSTQTLPLQVSFLHHLSPLVTITGQILQVRSMLPTPPQNA